MHKLLLGFKTQIYLFSLMVIRSFLKGNYLKKKKVICNENNFSCYKLS